MRKSLTAGLAALALAFTACGDDGTTAEDRGTSASSPTGTTGPTPSPSPGTYPEFGEEDYTYRLEVLCFCPLHGPVLVTVEDGKAVDAAVKRRGAADVPEYLLLTIDDIIAKANDPAVDKVTVKWPDGQAWPRSVSIDPDERAVDDEATYVIRDVQVG